MSYTISVIVPVYNAEQYLDKCITSLLEQTLPPTEIILVNDGSKDGSGALCDQYACEHANIKVVHKQNGGLVSAWMCGVENSTGEYLAFVDSDDWVDLHMFEEMSKELTGNPKEIISSDYVIERTDGTQEYVYQKLNPGVYDRMQIEELVIPNLLGHEHRYVTASRCMKLTARALIEDNMKYSDPSIRMAEDLVIMFPALLDCERLVVMDHKAYYHYLLIIESMAHNYDKGLYENNKKVMEILRTIIARKFATENEAMENHLLGQASKEEIFFLLLALKIEARGNKEGYYKNIRQICSDSEWIKECPVEVSDKSNQLLYFVFRHPNWITIHLLRLAMIVYYR